MELPTLNPARNSMMIDIGINLKADCTSLSLSLLVSSIGMSGYRLFQYKIPLMRERVW